MRLYLGNCDDKWTADSEHRRRRRNEFTGQCQCANGGARYGSTGASTNTTTTRDAVWVASLATLSHGPRDATAYSHSAVECFCRTQWSCTHCPCRCRKCATGYCGYNNPRGRTVSPGDQRSVSRSIISFPRNVYQAWIDPGKSASAGEYG